MTPPKDQAPGLVARLRAGVCDMPKEKSGYIGHPDFDATDNLMDEAATRIEQLEAENRRLRTDAGILLAQLDAHQANTEEYLEGEDWALVEQIRATLTDQANIRSPVQNLVRDQYNPEDEG